MRCHRREKVFGPGRAVPLDRNAKARIAAYARAWSARNRQPRQHRGPITRAFLDVLQALLWGFHNSRSGCCFPSYEAIAAKAECARSTVGGGAEGAGVGRRADLAEPHHPHPGARARPVRPVGEPLARHPHQQCLRVQRPETAASGGCLLLSPKIRREHWIKMFYLLYRHQHPTRTAPWSVP